MSTTAAASMPTRSTVKGLEAEYRAEIKRLQSKIGELVMENEIRREAMRPFSSVERALNGSLLDEDGAKP